MFIRTFTLISILFLLGACQDAPVTGDTAAKRSPQTRKENSQSRLEPEFLAWENDQEAQAYLKSYGQSNPENIVVIETAFGKIKIRLYQNTPLHRANFIYLVKEHQYFNGTWFHRVSPGHVIQAGNNDEYTLKALRDRIGKYQLAPERLGLNYHQYGAVAMARSYKNNPEKKSDPFEFYINLGKRYSQGQLDLMEKEYGIDLSPEQRALYTEKGGSPHLDLEHTVIGEVISGMEVVEAISKVETDKGEWPLSNVPIEVYLEK